MSPLERHRDQLENPHIHLPLWMAGQEWIMLLAGSSQTHNQPTSQPDVGLRSIFGQEKHRVHENGPLSENDVEPSSRKSKRPRSVIKSSRPIRLKVQSKGSIDLALESLIFIRFD
jgi:hypothetical protein